MHATSFRQNKLDMIVDPHTYAHLVILAICSQFFLLLKTQERCFLFVFSNSREHISEMTR
jgi:hypothetical protein